MGKTILCLMFLGLFVVPAYATYYEFTADTYVSTLTLHSGDSLYMTGGEIWKLFMLEDSIAIIEDTSHYGVIVFPPGGFVDMRRIELSGSSSFYMSGGQFSSLNMSQFSTAVLSGGSIQRICNQQQFLTMEIWDEITQTWIESIVQPQVTIECLNHFYDAPTNLLTGHWLNGTAFSIQLIDIDTPVFPLYRPTIEIIQFVPEPCTLLLLGLGGLLIRKR